MHSLQDVADPMATGGHILRYRYDREVVSGAPTINYTIQLRQGYVSEAAQGALIAQQSHNDVGDAFVEATLTLSPAEAATISDYADLQVRHIAEQV